MSRRKRYQITATCYDKRGRVISTGVNLYNKSHPLYKHFAVLAGESEEKIWQHAEFSACIAAGKKEIHSIFVERYHKDGSMANAEPCKTCKLMLKAFDVKTIRYTHDDGMKEIINEY